MNIERFFTSRFGIVLCATIACLLWGGAFPFIKISYSLLHIVKSDIFGQILFAGYRFFIASIMLLVLLVIKQRGIYYSKGSWPALLQVGMFQTTLQYILFYIGMSQSSGIQGSIISGSSTFFSVALAHYMYANDSISWRKVIGLILGFVGVCLASSTGGFQKLSFGIGEIALLFAACSSSFGGILAKNKAKKLDVLYVTAYQMLLGSIVLLFIGSSGAGFFPFHFDRVTIWYLLYLAFISAAGFLLWNTILKYNKVGKVSMYQFLIPVFGVLQSVIFLQEKLQTIVFVSLLFVVFGIIIVNLEKESQPKTIVADSILTKVTDVMKD